MKFVNVFSILNIKIKLYTKLSVCPIPSKSGQFPISYKGMCHLKLSVAEFHGRIIANLTI